MYVKKIMGRYKVFDMATKFILGVSEVKTTH